MYLPMYITAIAADAPALPLRYLYKRDIKRGDADAIAAAIAS